jgi:urease accessory protein
MKKIIVIAGVIAFSQAASAHTGLLPTDGFSHGFQHPFLGLDHFLAILGLGLWASSQSRLLAKQALGVFLLFMAAGALLGLAGIGFAYVETGILFSLLLVGIALSFGTAPIVPTLWRTLWSINPLVPTRCVGMQYRRATPRVTTNVLLSIRDAARPALHSHTARGNEIRWSVGTINMRKAIILTSIAAFASMHGLAHGIETPVNASAYAYIAGFISATAVLHVSGLALGWIAQRINAAGLIHIYGTLTGLTGAWLLLA